METQPFRNQVAAKTGLSEEQVESVWEATIRGAAHELDAGASFVPLGDLGRFKVKSLKERVVKARRLIHDKRGKVIGSEVTDETKSVPAKNWLTFKAAPKVNQLIT